MDELDLTNEKIAAKDNSAKKVMELRRMRRGKLGLRMGVELLIEPVGFEQSIEGREGDRNERQNGCFEMDVVLRHSGT
ncbi:uncharacterized protein MONOS_2976c1 [Monocercomonoides exilis]|uniref:uncharacterized protein n=1 Tax=Monocercomonoides exilis TaxID=2049356 RepID=UPI00355A3DBB|nr:hypothetical protein MONOS_2976c2 [Monocercomonoides exilis]KAH7824761.1 hypothetical protein MONOS_2976c1 [Monocercomonoides exilis]|eukprot:MONOS_2976.1-p1 / transcript=MONOS_2976.1 / gene=MONOS_2976 / organism=Monocercomonoides_exilis_PA203 / gene_product=unspecified product / transcript_product=unspecified product / location=Mono_scaffold00065:145985-146218(+) / protein_length=78 / sequence_SO=supercontig / SO=protein_coding / is_pseudo=false